MFRPSRWFGGPALGTFHVHTFLSYVWPFFMTQYDKHQVG